MNILFDSQAFDIQTHGGVSRCFAELYSHRVKDMNIKIGVIETKNTYLKNLGFPEEGYTYDNFLWKGHSKLKRILYKFHYNDLKNWDHTPKLNQQFSRDEIRSGKYQVYHPTYFDTTYLQYATGTPMVITVHDMIPELYPQFFLDSTKLFINKRTMTAMADHIIAVSNKTKEDLIRLFGIDEKKITVIYHGGYDENYNVGRNPLPNCEYVLYVGDRHLYKNFFKFVRDIWPCLIRHHNLKIVCTGKPFNYAEETILNTFNIRDKFIHIFSDTTQDLLDLYHYAICFVYPSEYEGFGIPILEAYKAGCPVMLNNASCFPEIAGDSAIYVDFKNEKNDFEEQFETLYHIDSNEKNNLLAKQLKRLKLFSWDKSAKELFKVYQNVIS